jgi:hypothetical protein
MLPTTFSISDEGMCHVEDYYINNLVPRELYSEIYGVFEALFAQFLPYIESIFSYALEL